MADIQQRTITPKPAANQNVNVFEITGQVFENGQLIGDFTGDNRLDFPACLGSLSPEQQYAIVDMLTDPVLGMKAGVQ